jgi:hypothetical protein
MCDRLFKAEASWLPQFKPLKKRPKARRRKK